MGIYIGQFRKQTFYMLLAVEFFPFKLAELTDSRRCYHPMSLGSVLQYPETMLFVKILTLLSVFIANGCLFAKKTVPTEKGQKQIGELNHKH